MPQELIDTAAANFKRLTVGVAASVGHFDNLQYMYVCTSPSLLPHCIINKPALFRDTHRLPGKQRLKR